MNNHFTEIQIDSFNQKYPNEINNSHSAGIFILLGTVAVFHRKIIKSIKELFKKFKKKK